VCEENSVLAAVGKRLVRALASVEERLAGLLLADSRRAYRLAFAAVVLAVVVTLVLLILLGAGRALRFAPDTAVVLDGGWRLYHGQRPHADFYCPVGCLPLLTITLGMWLTAPSAAAMNYGYAVLFLPFALWAWAVARRRVPAVQAGLFAALVGFLLVALRHLGWPYKETSYAGHYNRLGWAVYAILMLQVLVRPRESSSRWAPWLEGLSIGALLAMTPFIKMNFAAGAVLGVGVAVVLFRYPWRTWLGALIGGALVGGAVLAYLRFDVAAMIGDIRMLSGVQQPARRLYVLGKVVEANLPSLALIAACILVLTAPLLRQRSSEETGWGRVLLAGGAAAVLGVLVNGANALQEVDIPLFAVAALVLTEAFRRRYLQGADNGGLADARFRHLLGSLLAVYFMGLTLLPDAASIGYAFAWDKVKGPLASEVARIDTPTMRGLVLPPLWEERLLDSEQALDRLLEKPPEEIPTAFEHAQWVNAGLDILRPHLRPDDRILLLDSKNPFSFALELPPPTGGALFWGYGYVFDEQHCPPPEQVLRDVTLVMESKRPMSLAARDAMKQVYGPRIRQNFEVIAESRLWTLYRRTGGGPGQGPK
jgi:hypothetical protein